MIPPPREFPDDALRPKFTAYISFYIVAILFSCGLGIWGMASPSYQYDPVGIRSLLYYFSSFLHLMLLVIPFFFKGQLSWSSVIANLRATRWPFLAIAIVPFLIQYGSTFLTADHGVNGLGSAMQMNLRGGAMSFLTSFVLLLASLSVPLVLSTIRNVKWAILALAVSVIFAVANLAALYIIRPGLSDPGPFFSRPEFWVNLLYPVSSFAFLTGLLVASRGSSAPFVIFAVGNVLTWALIHVAEGWNRSYVMAGCAVAVWLLHYLYNPVRRNPSMNPGPVEAT